MLYAVKGNREVAINEKEKETFLLQGFNIIEVDAKGKQKVVAKAVDGSDKALAAKVEKLEAENEALKAQIAELTAEDDSEDESEDKPEKKK